jgi:Ran GTPase-activating protein (RanGAP) involved in mRNA processing and transport
MGSISKPTILTLHGRGLKLDTRDDIEQHLKDVDPAIIEEIHLNGNTIGVDASKALAEFLSKTRVLKVTPIFSFPSVLSTTLTHLPHRSPISKISSPAA